MPKTQLDHIGIAVKDVAAVTQLFKEILNASPYKTEDVPAQQVNTHFITVFQTVYVWGTLFKILIKF